MQFSHRIFTKFRRESHSKIHLSRSSDPERNEEGGEGPPLLKYEMLRLAQHDTAYNMEQRPSP